MNKLLVNVLIASVILITGCISVVKGPHKAYRQVLEKNVVFDAIIVPGIPLENGHWDSVMKARVIWSWILYKNGVTKNVIYSGGAVYSPYCEAKIMGLYAQKLGIAKEHIFYDTIARHSTENAFYSYLVAKEQGFKILALTTDPFQSALLQGFTNTRMGTPIYHMPFVMDSVKKYNYLNPTIQPESARGNDFISITEEGRIKRIFGTLGGEIDWQKYNGQLPPL